MKRIVLLLTLLGWGLTSVHSIGIGIEGALSVGDEVSISDLGASAGLLLWNRADMALGIHYIRSKGIDDDEHWGVAITADVSIFNIPMVEKDFAAVIFYFGLGIAGRAKIYTTLLNDAGETYITYSAGLRVPLRLQFDFTYSTSFFFELAPAFSFNFYEDGSLYMGGIINTSFIGVGVVLWF